MTTTALIKLLKGKGWVFIRQAGSHKIFKHPDFEKHISLPDHKGDIPTGTLHQILKKAGLK